MEVLFLYPDLKKSSQVSDYIAKYIRNTSKFTKINHFGFKNFSIDDPESKKKKEAEVILKQIKDNDFLILFDEKGEQKNSQSFASYIEGLDNKRVVFVIGGPFGFHQSVYERANQKIALSKLTFNAELASLVASEQIFRIFSIIAGHPYHNN